MLKSVKIRDGHDNFFTPLRLIFAILVVVGHSFSVTMSGSASEPKVFIHYTFSYIAVNLFFIASGFLVTKSILYRGSVPEYSSARLLRIYPALIVHVLFVMFIIGPLATNMDLAAYFTHADFWKQPFLVLSFIDTDMFLPGLFLDNNEAYTSAPLWTLRYEILAYIGTAILFSLGLLKKRWMVLATFVVPAVLWMATHETGIHEQLPATVQSIIRFAIPFGLGAAIYSYRDRLKFNVLTVLALFGFTWLIKDTESAEIGLNLALAALIMWVAYIKVPALNFLQKMSDVSYGIYIYHWCVLQVLFDFFPNLTTLSIFLITLPITWILATLSWHFVEKPMLQRKKSFAQYLRFKRRKTSLDPV